MVIDMNEFLEEMSPHKVSEVVCLKCLKRWWAVRPEDTMLISLECPSCSSTGFVIETGENIKQED